MFCQKKKINCAKLRTKDGQAKDIAHASLAEFGGYKTAVGDPRGRHFLIFSIRIFFFCFLAKFFQKKNLKLNQSDHSSLHTIGLKIVPRTHWPTCLSVPRRLTSVMRRKMSLTSHTWLRNWVPFSGKIIFSPISLGKETKGNHVRRRQGTLDKFWISAQHCLTLTANHFHPPRVHTPVLQQPWQGPIGKLARSRFRVAPRYLRNKPSNHRDYK